MYIQYVTFVMISTIDSIRMGTGSETSIHPHLDLDYKINRIE